MQVVQHTETKLVLEPYENQFLYTALQIGGVFIFVGIVLFGADFRTNPSYELTSAQNLNSCMKILGGLSILIGLRLSFTGINNRDNTYIFDKELSKFKIIEKGLVASSEKEYAISSIKDVAVNKVEFTQPNTLPEGYTYSFVTPTSDEFFVSLELETETRSEKILLTYRSSNFQLVNDLADTLRKFLEIAA
jgi:hypothetical protein